MLTHQLRPNDGILIVSPTAPLEAKDFQELASEIDPFIDQQGVLNGLMIEAESFVGWHDFGALLSHLRFVRDHHAKIKKVAAVTDNAFLAILPRVVAHFVNAEVRHFSTTETAAALEWLKAP